MDNNKMSPNSVLFIITLVFYAVGFLGSKNTEISAKIVLLSMLVSILILLLLKIKKYNISQNYYIVYGTIGMNNTILCALLNSIEIGENLKQQAIVLGFHILIFITIIIFLEICYGTKKHPKKNKAKTTVSATLITLVVGLGIGISRYLLHYGIEIRLIGCFSLGFLCSAMFYIFLIRVRRGEDQSEDGSVIDDQSGDGSVSRSESPD